MLDCLQYLSVSKVQAFKKSNKITLVAAYWKYILNS